MNSRQKFYESVREFTKTNQWDQLVLYQDPFLEKRTVDQINGWLLVQLIINEEFTEGAYHALHRLFGPRTPSDWTSLLVEKYSNFPAIHCLLDHGEIDVRCGDHSIVSYVLNHGLYDTECKLELLDKLFEHGADVNEQEPRFRCSLLKNYITSVIYEVIHNEHEMRSLLNELYQIIPYLLEKGADPLLEDRDGQNTIQMVQKYNVVPPTEKDRLLMILHAYSSS